MKENSTANAKHTNHERNKYKMSVQTISMHIFIHLNVRYEEYEEMVYDISNFREDLKCIYMFFDVVFFTLACTIFVIFEDFFVIVVSFPLQYLNSIC